jgi:hypothetical protein
VLDGVEAGLVPLELQRALQSRSPVKVILQARLLRPVIMSTSLRPAPTASSTTYWMAGASTTGSISFGIALVAGRKRVPRPAAGITALRTDFPNVMNEPYKLTCKK